MRRVSLGFPCQRPWWMPSLMYTWTLPGTRWRLATRAAFVRNRGSSRLMQRLEKKSLSLDISSPGRITLSFSWDNMRYSLQPSSQLTYYRNISTHQPVQFHPSKSPAAPAAGRRSNIDGQTTWVNFTWKEPDAKRVAAPCEAELAG